jgi:hypothetical protein
MSKKQNLQSLLRLWSEKGGDLNELLGNRTERRIKDPADAAAICAALTALRSDPGLQSVEYAGSAVHTLAQYFQSVKTPEAMVVFRDSGLPVLRWWVRDAVQSGGDDVDDVMFLLKILGMYRQCEDVHLIADAARKGIGDDNFMWSMIFGQFDHEHPHSNVLLEEFREPLPTGFIGINYLDLANRLAMAGQLENHPFNTAQGVAQLDVWLRDSDPLRFSFARSATATIPFLSVEARQPLLQIAAIHPDPMVRLDSAWAQAKSGDSRGADRLIELCLDPCFCVTAQSYLEELGQSESIPTECLTPEFQALAEMANWLAHPMEYGRAPSRVSIYDSRELFWTPRQERLQVFLVKYEYDADDDDEASDGIGMVGSTTFALFDCVTSELSPEDVYALHCCWELSQWDDNSRESMVAAGRGILSEHNEGF